jgi:uncharacterized membrane protein
MKTVTWVISLYDPNGEKLESVASIQDEDIEQSKLDIAEKMDNIWAEFENEGEDGDTDFDGSISGS